MTESENHPEVTGNGATGAAQDRGDGSGAVRPSGRRPVSILPWEAAEPSSEQSNRPGRPARRSPVPPSGLLSAPAPANRTEADDPFAALPPWLPPVRRPAPGRPFRPARGTGPDRGG